MMSFLVFDIRILKELAGIAGMELTKAIKNFDDAQTCEIVLHEIMHAAGVKAGGSHNSEGNDQIYACSRVCSGCNHISLGSGDDHKDCAICASDIGHKEVCGLKIKVTDTVVPDGNNKSCAAIIGSPPDIEVITAACDSRHIDILTCDDKLSRMSSGMPFPTPVPWNPWCCEMCPAPTTVGGTGLSGWCDQLRDQSKPGNNQCLDSAEKLFLCKPPYWPMQT